MLHADLHADCLDARLFASGMMGRGLRTLAFSRYLASFFLWSGLGQSLASYNSRLITQV